MTIKSKIDSDLKTSLKAKEADKAQLLRGLLASIKNAEISEKGELDDEKVVQILRTELKQRKEAAGEYTKGGRDDLAKKEKAEAEMIEKYLPQLMSEEEVEAEVKKVIEETGAQDKSEMGKVMGAVMGKLQGKADGGMVNKIVAKLLG